MQPTPDRPQAAYRGSSASSGAVTPERPREDRLRGLKVYRRVESAQELEADLGTLRALGSHAGPLSAWIIAVAALSFALSLYGGYSLLTAYPNEPAFLLVPVGLGLCIAVAVLTKLRMVTEAPRDKLDLASSLVRRLEFAPGAKVDLVLEFAGFKDQNQRTLTPPFGLPSWRESFNRCHADPWLSLEAQLEGGISLRVFRCSYRLQEVTNRRSGSVTVSSIHRTAHAIEDGVELRYEPSSHPALSQLGEAISASLRLAPGCVLTMQQNQPGLLALTTMTEPREAPTNHSSDLVTLVEQALLLAAPGRALFRAERDAQQPVQDLVVMRRGAVGQLTRNWVRPKVKLVGAVLLLLAALGLGFLAYFEHGHVEARRAWAQQARKELHEHERKLSAAVGDSAEYQADLKTKIADSKRAAATYDGETSEELQIFVAEIAGGAVCLAGSLVLLVLGLRAKRAQPR